VRAGNRAVQAFAVHEPFGEMLNVVPAVMSPRLLPLASRPWR
jgi:hypothetical protein